MYAYLLKEDDSSNADGMLTFTDYDKDYPIAPPLPASQVVDLAALTKVRH
jgi:hypothetical protein